MTPYPDLPYSHKGLQVFESVARLMSFTLAANELNVTQSAVSRQVKQLEDDLNESLVIRKNRSIELTLKGESLYSALESNYQSIQSLLASWKSIPQKKIVIKAALSYATRSLIPKTQMLIDRYPDYEIVIVPTIDEDESINASDYDLLILNTRRGSLYKNTPNIHYLREEYMAPVCAQQLVAEGASITSIFQMPRLHPTMDHFDWNTWLRGTKYKVEQNARNTTFFTLDMALSACLAGQGVTVTDLLLILPELEHGYLVCPPETPVQFSPWQYFCHSRSQSPVIDELVAWLKAESEKEIEILSELATKHQWLGVVR
ncbi:LysR family transcriptional regulator [Vibrio hippocampi]|uniref:Glycine cleavage system transcriptional activator n=1 Tax=Vibrio hippocampi TaxID=654686 RepID=A0ABN8DHS5_9VIBR|nr:LysR family transcriptional regulator [Vibrio hippocampi]CAH0526231.1 Glycine cleavage system transcriptional activator [Vibrio hippocampi]